MNLKKVMNFLFQLHENNNRDWFKENKALYDEAKQEFEKFIEELIPFSNNFDPEIGAVSSKDCIFRIFRDVRFSKDKSPYKTNFGAFIASGGRKSPYAGFYVHLEPEESFVSGGVYMPEAKNLKAIRTEIFENPEDYKKIINNSKFKKYFKGVYGEKLKMAPRDFPKDFADIELLKHKHYAVVHNVNNTFWNRENLFDELAIIFKTLSPFNKFINKAISKEIDHFE